MYYVTIVAAVVAAFLLARLCVACAARLNRRVPRLVTFWGLILPGALLGCIGLFVFSAGDDMYLSSEPSYVIWLVCLLGSLVLSLIVLGIRGLRSDPDQDTAKAKSLPIGRAVMFCLTSLGLLLVSLWMYDVQLRSQLAGLKAEAVQQWQAIAREPIDPKLRAAGFAPLISARDTIDAWPDSLFEKLLREIDLSDPRFADLESSCGEAFGLIRGGLPDVEGLMATVNFNSRDDWLSDDADRSRLKKVIFLYAINSLIQAERGDLAAAIEDQRRLRQFALVFADSASYQWVDIGAYAFASFSESIERLLIIDPEIDQAVLKGFVDESLRIRKIHPDVFSAAGAFFIADTCDHYLGVIDPRSVMDPSIEKLNALPAPARGLFFAHLRLRRARDEMIAIRRATELFGEFGQRHDDPTATSQSLVQRRQESITLGHLARFDPRDIIFYRSNHHHGRQQILNTAIAATLFKRESGTFPDRVEQLVPKLLTKIPIDMDEGRPIHMQPNHGGLIISGTSDGERMQYREEQSFGREFAESLSSAFFLGSAYLHFFKDIPSDEQKDDAALNMMFESE